MKLSSIPHLVQEWHPTRNGELTPSDYTHGSDRKVWWVCLKGHSYSTSVSDRTRQKPISCAYCAGKKASKENNLEALFPEIAKEWHSSKNNDLSPNQVTRGSTKKVWWECAKRHSYESIISNRTGHNKSGCPYCAGKKASDENNLEALFPEIAKEWHPTKNKDLVPSEVTYGTHKKVWWLCPKEHSYESAVKGRTGKHQNGCPQCSNQSSEPEIRILAELEYFFDKVINRHKVDRVEVDIFLPNLNLGIEYDGNYWHKDKEIKDLEKNKFLLSKGIQLIRVRQFPLKPISENDLLVSIKHSLDKNDINKLLKKITPFVDSVTEDKIKSYLIQPSFNNQKLFLEYRSYFPSPLPENSLLNTHPQIAKEWDYDKNKPLRPENYSFGAHYNAWWLCSKGHNYQSTIVDRVRTMVKCPFCQGKKTLNFDLWK